MFRKYLNNSLIVIDGMTEILNGNKLLRMEEVFNRYYGLKPFEIKSIAKELNVSVPTVERDLFKIKQILKEEFSPEVLKDSAFKLYRRFEELLSKNINKFETIQDDKLKLEILKEMRNLLNAEKFLLQDIGAIPKATQKFETQTNVLIINQFENIAQKIETETLQLKNK